MIRLVALAAGLMLCAGAPALAEPRPGFSAGPVFENFGETAEVDADFAIPPWMVFKVAFDVSAPAEAGEVSRKLNTPARFINMHVRAGVREENISLAVVVHGKAAFDLLTDKAYKTHNPDAAGNASGALVKALLDEGVHIYLCGQTAAAYGLEKEELIPGVEMSLSAMTAHAWLQQQDYTLNPF